MAFHELICASMAGAWRLTYTLSRSPSLVLAVFSTALHKSRPLHKTAEGRAGGFRKLIGLMFGQSSDDR